MVGFWADCRKRERMKVLERIKMAEKHGIGDLAMSEKARLKKLERIIELRKE